MTWSWSCWASAAEGPGGGDPSDVDAPAAVTTPVASPPTTAALSTHRFMTPDLRIMDPPRLHVDGHHLHLGV
jgi:hypothetical protein